MPARRKSETLVGVIGFTAVTLISGCSKEDTASPAGVRSLAPVNQPADSNSSDFAASLPRVGGPAGYTGSESCRSCHEEQFTSWHRSYHRTMTQFATPDSVRADFRNVALTNDNVRLVLQQKSNEFWVRMEKIQPSTPATSGNTGVSEFLDARIGLVTGSHHMQVFWVPGGDGNTQIGFPFTWLIPEARWVPRHSTFVRPSDLPHQSEIWNVSCSRCHATATEPHVDYAAHTMNTQVAELGIACEACHGPGQRHVEARSAEHGRGTTPAAQTLRSEIVHPKKIDPARASQICGFCHSMKWFDQSENWRQTGFSFRPGDDLEQTTPIIRASQTNRPAGLTAFLARNPEILRDFFWPDGMIRVSGREYNGLIESPCHRSGKFSCLSCHSLHESEPDGQLGRNKRGNAACTQCHESFRDEGRLIAHTRHPAASSGSECYNCHMPYTTYGVLKAIRSHQVSSPDVAAELATGRPNACNLCHLDKTLAWTAGILSRWTDRQAPSLLPVQTNVADSVRLALSGDAGQRVLMAWHLGWAPALQVSGGDWIPGILVQLLDDPYAAVRCVAERSLRRVAPGLVPDDYDFAIPIESRLPIPSSTLEKWRTELKAKQNSTSISSAQTALGDSNELRETIQQLIRQRDETPVRLRE
jgi:predicted CXXCH cytochrome family protein